MRSASCKNKAAVRSRWRLPITKLETRFWPQNSSSFLAAKFVGPLEFISAFEDHGILAEKWRLGRSHTWTQRHLRVEFLLKTDSGYLELQHRFLVVQSLGRFHLIIPGNQKTEFRNQRWNSRALLPFNQSGFERIRGVVKNNGSHQHML